MFMKGIYIIIEFRMFVFSRKGSGHLQVYASNISLWSVRPWLFWYITQEIYSLQHNEIAKRTDTLAICEKYQWCLDAPAVIFVRDVNPSLSSETGAKAITVKQQRQFECYWILGRWMYRYSSPPKSPVWHQTTKSSATCRPHPRYVRRLIHRVMLLMLHAPKVLDSKAPQYFDALVLQGSLCVRNKASRIAQDFGAEDKGMFYLGLGIVDYRSCSSQVKRQRFLYQGFKNSGDWKPY